MKKTFNEVAHHYIGIGLERGGILTVTLVDICNETADWSDMKPLLHPMENLLKEMTFNGETFVPILKLLEIASSLGLEWVKPQKQTLIGFETWGLPQEKGSIDEFYGMKYSEHDKVMVFGYSARFDRFSIQELNPTKPLGVGYQLEMFMKLFEWGFDVFNLIENGEAININLRK